MADSHANDEMLASWGSGAAGWVANEALFDSLFTPMTGALVSLAGPADGRSILDVGCG